MQCPAVTGEPNVRVSVVPTSSAGVAVWTMAMPGHRPRPVIRIRTVMFLSGQTRLALTAAAAVTNVFPFVTEIG
jgi:hypothetical protein